MNLGLLFPFFFLSFFSLAQWGLFPSSSTGAALQIKKTKKFQPEGCVWKQMAGLQALLWLWGEECGEQWWIFCPQNFLTPFGRIIFSTVLPSRFGCTGIKMETVDSNINIPKECHGRGRSALHKGTSSGQEQTVAQTQYVKLDFWLEGKSTSYIRVKWSEVKWSRSVVSDSLRPHGL